MLICLSPQRNKQMILFSFQHKNQKLYSVTTAFCLRLLMGHTEKLLRSSRKRDTPTSFLTKWSGDENKVVDPTSFWIPGPNWGLPWHPWDSGQCLETFLVTTTGRGPLLTSGGGMARDAAQQLSKHRTDPNTKRCPA